MTIEPNAPHLRSPNPLPLVAIVVAGVLAGGLIGGLTNMVNGAVSPRYFVVVMRWRGVEDIWRAAVAQGVFEGLLFGLVLAVAFAAATGVITGAACSFRFAMRHLLGIVSAASVCWVIGGLLAMGLAMLSPEFYRQTFIGVPDAFDAMLRYAWVGGSIWGLQFGGLASLIVGIVVLRANWRSHVQQA